MTKLLPAAAKQNELAVPITQPLELSVQDLIQRQAKIENVVRQVMKPGIDYGVIPGTERPVLFQTGAQVLAQTFQFSQRYELRRYEFEGGHFEFEALCRLIHIPTDLVTAEGIGSATSLEPKYRYRRGEPESTGRQVPQHYWPIKKTNPAKFQEMIGGKNFLVKPIDGVWMICTRSEERLENEDPAEVYNTIRKMAAKRSFIHAVLNATAASRVFSDEQLDEDLEIEHPYRPTRRESPARTTTPATPSDEKPEPKSYKAALWDALIEAYDKARVPAELKRLTGKNSISELSEEQARDALLFFEGVDDQAKSL